MDHPAYSATKVTERVGICIRRSGLDSANATLTECASVPESEANSCCYCLFRSVKIGENRRPCFRVTTILLITFNNLTIEPLTRYGISVVAGTSPPKGHRMPTQKQIDATRENAKRSTGPKTPGGKYNSCQNAITHGLFAKSILLSGEFADRFNGLMAAYINHFNPTPTNSNSSKPWPPIVGARRLDSPNRQPHEGAGGPGRHPRPLSERGPARQNSHRASQPHQRAPQPRKPLPPGSATGAADCLRAPVRLRTEYAKKKKTLIGSQLPTQNQQLNDFPEPKRSIDEPSTKPDQSLNEA